MAKLYIQSTHKLKWILFVFVYFLTIFARNDLYETSLFQIVFCRVLVDTKDGDAVEHKLD